MYCIGPVVVNIKRLTYFAWHKGVKKDVRSADMKWTERVMKSVKKYIFAQDLAWQGTQWRRCCWAQLTQFTSIGLVCTGSIFYLRVSVCTMCACGGGSNTFKQTRMNGGIGGEPGALSSLLDIFFENFILLVHLSE